MNRPVVWLHGWGMKPDVWQPLLSHLPSTWNHQLLTLPGHGAHAPRPESEHWCASLLPAIPHGCLLCGWSLGAMLALALAARAPERIAGLLLFSASARFVADDTYAAGLPAATVAAFQADFQDDAAATLQRFLALQVLGDARRHDVLAHLRAGRSPEPSARLLPGLHQLCTLDLRAATRHITRPVRLIHGAHDALMPPSAAMWLGDRLPGAQLSLLDDCGHAPFLSRPRECASLARGFADELA